MDQGAIARMPQLISDCTEGLIGLSGTGGDIGNGVKCMPYRIKNRGK